VQQHQRSTCMSFHPSSSSTGFLESDILPYRWWGGLLPYREPI
jgi:hypothetical protein